MAESSEGVRGRLFGTTCAGCYTEFTDEDVPIFHGPAAPLAATGWTMTCRYCRERGAARPRPKSLSEQQAELGRAWRVAMAELATTLRIPNLAKRLGMTPRR